MKNKKKLSKKYKKLIKSFDILQVWTYSFWITFLSAFGLFMGVSILTKFYIDSYLASLKLYIIPTTLILYILLSLATFYSINPKSKWFRKWYAASSILIFLLVIARNYLLLS